MPRSSSSAPGPGVARPCAREPRGTRSTVFLLTLLLGLCAPALLQAQDTEIERGIRMYRVAADPAGAAATLSSALARPGLRPEERLRARVYLSLSLFALGDSTEATRQAFFALDQDPCLEIAPEVAPARHIELFYRPRPPRAWCLPNEREAAMGSLMIPGSSQVKRGDVPKGAVLMATSVLGVGFGAYFLGSSFLTYGDYESATSTAAADRLYGQAHRERMLGAGALTVGLGTWIYNVLEARSGARARRREIEGARALVVAMEPAEQGQLRISTRVAF